MSHGLGLPWGKVSLGFRTDLFLPGPETAGPGASPSALPGPWLGWGQPKPLVAPWELAHFVLASCAEMGLFLKAKTQLEAVSFIL